MDVVFVDMVRRTVSQVIYARRDGMALRTKLDEPRNERELTPFS